MTTFFPNPHPRVSPETVAETEGISRWRVGDREEPNRQTGTDAGRGASDQKNVASSTVTASEKAHAAGGKRVAWADTAKGFSILAVCLMHVVTMVPGGMDTSWGMVKLILDPLRMPLFFLVSGLFAHRVVERSLSDLWFRRLWFLLVPYLVFTPVIAANRLYIDGKLFTTPPPSITAPSVIPGLPVRLDLNAIVAHMDYATLAKAIVFGDPGLWFLCALMLYNVAAWSVRKLPAWLAVAVSFIPAYLGSVAGYMSHQGVRQVLTYLPIFFVGLFFRQVVFRLANHAFSCAVVVTTLSVFIVSEVATYALNRTLFAEWNDTVAAVTVGTGLLRIFAAIPFGIVFATWLSQTPLIAPALTAIGRHTLPIYVSHQAALAYGMFLLGGFRAQDAEFVQIFDNPQPLIYLGFAICAVSGFMFYGLGKIPVVGWVLYPPSLRPKR
ncbi:acyltransferase family protein [Corynebacterium auriscanis]|uniref:acyltransferase family protein n=1 Tax=Corynebacterium auriscanis TaxID=99807 RepID=UPI0024ACEBA3|nr:acyltransferase family protein [Corynebacterium auriscanis]